VTTKWSTGAPACGVAPGRGSGPRGRAAPPLAGAPLNESLLEMVNDAVAELRAAGAGLLAVAGELPGDVVGHVQLAARPLPGRLLALGERRLQPLVDQRRRLAPAQLLQQQHARQQHGAGVGLVLAGVLRRRAVRRLEH